MRFITLSLLAVIGLASVADADRYDRRDRRDDRRGDRYDRRPVVRDRGVDRRYDRAPRSRYNGPVRANRRVIDRRPLYVNSGNFRFHNGREVVYRRPVIRNRYYDVRIRPQVIVENYPSQYGYVWVNGHWNWTGAEWTWIGGHYDVDATYSTYYDDDSYE